jgi:hypothetical protein
MAVGKAGGVMIRIQGDIDDFLKSMTNGEKVVRRFNLMMQRARNADAAESAARARQVAAAEKRYYDSSASYWMSSRKRMEQLSKAQTAAEIADTRRQTEAKKAAATLAIGFRREEFQMLKEFEARKTAAVKAAAQEETRAARAVSAAEKAAASARAGKIAGQQKAGAIFGSAGAAGGQMLAGVRGGLGGVWLMGSGLSGLASAAGMAFPALSGVFGAMGAVANVAANAASVVITFTQALIRSAVAAVRFGVTVVAGIIKTAWGIAQAIGAATVAIARFASSVVLGGLRRVWDLTTGILGTVKALVVKMGLLALAATATAVATGAAATRIIKSWVDAYSEAETYQAKLMVAFKDDMALAQGWFEWAKKTAMTTPFTTSEVVDSITRLALYGMEKFGSLAEWFKMTGDMAGAMGRSVSDAVEAIVDVIYGGGMERIKEFGINSFELIQKGAKPAKSGGVARQTAEDIDKLVKALKAVMVDKFANGMDKLRNTLKGLASDIKDFAWIIKVSLGSAFAPAIRILIPVITKAMSALATWVASKSAEWAPKLEAFAKKAVAAFGSFQTWLSSKIPAIVAWFKKLWEGIKKWVADQGGLAGIWKKVSEFGIKLWDALKSVWTFLRTASVVIWGALQEIGSRFQAWIEGSGGLKTVGEKVKAFAANMWDGFVRLAGYLEWAYGVIKPTLMQLKAAFLSWLEGKGGLAGLWQTIVTVGTRIWGAVSGRLVPALKYLWAMVGWVASRLTKGMGFGGVGTAFESLVAWVSFALVRITSYIPQIVSWLEAGWTWIQARWQAFAGWLEGQGGMAGIGEKIRAYLLPVMGFLKLQLMPTIYMLIDGFNRMWDRISGGEGSGNKLYDIVTLVIAGLQSLASWLPAIGSGIRYYIIDPIMLAVANIRSLVDAFLLAKSALPGGESFKSALARFRESSAEVISTQMRMAGDAGRFGSDLAGAMTNQTAIEMKMKAAQKAYPGGGSREVKVSIIAPQGYTASPQTVRTNWA